MSDGARSRGAGPEPLTIPVPIGIALALPLALGLLSATGCAKGVKEDFPRPPATATLPLPEERAASEPAEEPTPVEVAAPVDVSSAEEPDAPAPPAVNASPIEPRATPEPDAPRTAPPPPSPSTQLGGRGPSDDPDVTAKLRRAGTLLSSVNLRELSDGQRQQLNAARTFVAQARRALRDGDERRALVLVDKGLILVQDVERSSRP